MGSKLLSWKVQDLDQVVRSYIVLSFYVLVSEDILVSWYSHTINVNVIFVLRLDTDYPMSTFVLFLSHLVDNLSCFSYWTSSLCSKRKQVLTVVVDK